MRTRIGTSLLSLVLTVGFLVAVPAGPVSAATTVLNPADRGRWDEFGQHLSFDQSYTAGIYAGPPTGFRNYFTFDLSAGLPCGTITGATLTAPNPGGVGLLRSYTLHDVSASSAAALDSTDFGSAAGMAIYSDLGTGSSFGSVLPTTVNDTPIVVPFNAAGIAALNAARGGTFSVGGALAGATLGDILFTFTSSVPVADVSLTLTTDPFLQPDAQIKGGPASLTYLGDDIYNHDGTDQTFQRQVRPGFGDKFNVKVQNDSNCFTDSFLVEGGPVPTRFKASYWYEGVDVTSDVVAGIFETPKLRSGESVDLTVFIYAKRGTRSGASMTDLITATSGGVYRWRGETVPVASDVVGARLVVNKKAGDFNSQLPIP